MSDSPPKPAVPASAGAASKPTTCATRPYIGGQAVIEGVMMRAPEGVSVAVRRPDGQIAVRSGPLPKSLRPAYWKLPGLRGIATLGEALSLGYSALQFSVEQQEEAVGTAPTSTAALWSLPLSWAALPAVLRTSLAWPTILARIEPEEPSETGPSASLSSEASTSGSSDLAKGARLGMIVGSILALGLFIALPQLLATLTGNWLGLELSLADWRFHALTGAFKLLIVTAYIATIGTVFEDLRRVWQYHGAEHKTIYAYEAGLPLSVENVAAQSRLHPRCGTTFVLTVVIVSIILGSIFTPLLLPNAAGLGGQISTLALRIGLLPLIAAVAYELQRLGARYCTTGPLQVLLWPGFAFQKLTTREPDAAQIEIAIASMQSAIWRARDRGDETRVERFETLQAVTAQYRS